MDRLPATHIVHRSAALLLVAAVLTASSPMEATALRTAPAPAATEPTVVRATPEVAPVEPLAIASIAPAMLAEAPHDPSVDRQEAAGTRLVARDAGLARAEAIAKARAEAKAKAEAEARAKAAAEKARKAAEAKAKAEAAAAAKAKAEAATKAEAKAKAKAEAEAKAAATAKAKAAAAKSSAQSTPSAGQYRGRNHFWYPALGINTSVAWFPCSRAEEPGTPVYRWGCAGANNVYLMAHAWSHFKPLARAYYTGGLKAGQLAVYADNNGRVHYYRLEFLKVGPPTTAQSWAWAAQSRSSMTLQTCIGANSELRLFVRFREVAAP